MPTINELHDPEPDAVHDRHAAERQRLGDMLFGPGRCELTGAAHEEARAAWDAHHLACLKTFETQHATVQEYAAWRFRMSTEVDLPAVDTEALGSVAEVKLLAFRLEEAAREARHAAVASLPVAQPAGLAAFTDVGRALRFWRHFTARELGRSGGGCRSLVTVDRVDGVWHVCFMHDWSHVGVSVTNAICELASVVYREALTLAEARWAAEMPGWRRGLGRVVPAGWRRPALSPSSFRFYEHVPPQRPGEEDFDLVKLDFRDGRFCNPGWRPYASISQVIASGRHDLRRDAEVRPGLLAAPGAAGVAAACDLAPFAPG
jgi:hypothetical protein